MSAEVSRFLENTCIFCQPWWLQTVSPNHWDIAVVMRGGNVAAVLPYVYRLRLRKYLLLEMPLLTPYLGPWVTPCLSRRQADRVAEEKDLVGQLITELPLFASFNQWFHPCVTNWLPFYWRGFEQTTYYTYIIEDLSDPEKVVADFAHSKRKNINKAERLVEVQEDLPCKEFYDHLVMTLAKQGKVVCYDFEFFRSVYSAAYDHNAAKVFYAVDAKGNIHSAIFTVSDQASAYYLVSSIDPEFRFSESVSLLVRAGIRYYSGKTVKFDFAGSMIESIERSSRSFGGTQVPYLVVSRMNSLTVRVYRELWRRVHRP